MWGGNWTFELLDIIFEIFAHLDIICSSLFYLVSYLPIKVFRIHLHIK